MDRGKKLCCSEFNLRRTLTGAGTFEIAAILHLSDSMNPKTKYSLQKYIYFSIVYGYRGIRE